MSVLTKLTIAVDKIDKVHLKFELLLLSLDFAVRNNFQKLTERHLEKLKHY